VSSNHSPVRDCTAITILTAFESFVGVLFSSLCAALMFAKVARAQSFAQVMFSDPMVIRYGTGVWSEEHDDDDDENNNSKDMKPPAASHIPCPVLEFRIVNKLSSLPGGEIIDATLNMVASIDAAQADLSFGGTTGRRKRGKKKRGPTRANSNQVQSHHNVFDSFSSPPIDEEQELLSPSIPKHSVLQINTSSAPRDASRPLRGPAPSISPQLRYRQPQEIRPRSQQAKRGPPPIPPIGKGGTRRRVSSLGSSIMQKFATGRASKHKRESYDSATMHSLLHNPMNQVSMRNTNIQAFEEDPSGKLMPKKILSKLDVDTPDHPYFRHIWLVRHTLDVNSLLLKPHVRQMLQRNRGFWPPELNNYESIRASLEFDQILVSFSGTSNADANSVYAQHVYFMPDINIGYRFVNALYRNPKDRSLGVDQKLINDVQVQNGGGGEPLSAFRADRLQDMLVL